MKITGVTIRWGHSRRRCLGLQAGIIRESLDWKWKYDDILKGKPGKILTTTDARGIELDGIGEKQRRTTKRLYTENKSGCRYTEICTAGGTESDGRNKGRRPERVALLRMNPQNGVNLCLL